MSREPVPVILDTDIGCDIDDTWALIMLLRSPELDVRLVTTCSSNAPQRARYVAKLLEIAGRTDIPVGVGRLAPETGTYRTVQADWIDDYDLARYPGTVHPDAARAIVETICQSVRPVTLIAIGPLSTVAEALLRDSGIVENSRFVGMHGSIRRGYGPGSPPVAETNVRLYRGDCQHVFSSPWQMTITPLDTCDQVALTDELYQQVRQSGDPLLRALNETNEIFARSAPWLKGRYDPALKSSTLFDTVAVYLAFSEELLKIEQLPLVVTDDGFTRIDNSGKMIRCATEWKDLAAFRRLLVDRMVGR